MLRFKKKTLMFITAMLSLCLLLTACGDTVKDKTDTTGLDLSGETEELTLPISEEGLTLSMYIGLDAKVSAHSQSYNEVAFFQELEKRTGIHFEFQHASGTAVDEQFNLLIASGSLPDIIMYKWLLSSVGVDNIVNDGVILRLNNYINKYAPNYKKLLNDEPQFKKEIQLVDGSIPIFGVAQLDPLLGANTGFMIRQDWLDRLGLEMPGTIEEWYTVLKAFKEQDANGNGDPNDEIPFICGSSAWFNNFLGAYGIGGDGFYVKDGVVKYAPLEPEYRDYIETMAKWYKEGLIDNEYLTVGLSNKMVSNVAGAAFGSISGNLGKWTEQAQVSVPEFNLVGAPWPEAADGNKYCTRSDYVRSIVDSGMAISSNCENIKEAVKWIDYLYSEEGTRLVQFGIEGESYEMIDGVETFTDKVLNNQEGWSTDQAVAKYAFPHIVFPKVGSPTAYNQIQLASQVQKDTAATWLDCDTSLLAADFLTTAEESAEVASTMVQITTFKDEMFTKLIIGSEPFDNYDSIIENIKSMGIDKVLEINQRAYERFNNAQ